MNILYSSAGTSAIYLFKIKKHTLQGINISPKKWHFEDDFPFPQVGYVNSLEDPGGYIFSYR